MWRMFSVLPFLGLVGAWRTSNETSWRNTAVAYDYVVIGCGIAGLVVSARLSERDNVSVLCLEAGPLDQGEPEILVPYFIGEQAPNFYEWGLSTVSQDQLDGAVRRVPCGRGVGGGSLINGMIWNRGSQASFDTWASFDNSSWDWHGLLPYFMKSETYTPKRYIKQDFPAPEYNDATHAKMGPVQVGYSSYFWEQSNNWFAALESLGIPLAADPNEGLAAGGYFLPLSIHPTNQTRSDSRRTYYDLNIGRHNLDIWPNSHVTRILFESSSVLRAVAVEYASNRSSESRVTVDVRREVILAAGALHTPQILELSGIGQAKILESFGINVLQDLPGVGNNLQDHAMVHVSYPYRSTDIFDIDDFHSNLTFNKDCEAEYYASKTGPWTAKPSQAVAFLSLQQFIDNTEALLEDLAKRDADHLPSGYDATLRAGYERQLSTLLGELHNGDIPALEILNNNAGGLDVALQRPLSRGTCHISSADPFQSPAIDPRWLADPFDFDVLISAMMFNQRILDTPEIQTLQPSYENIPQNASVEQLSQYLKSRVGTEYHFSSTAVMMPRQWGGVVDENLVVYGTQNLRVVDTSMFPVIPGAHLQAVVYAVAEKAADIIKGVGSGPA